MVNWWEPDLIYALGNEEKLQPGWVGPNRAWAENQSSSVQGWMIKVIKVGGEQYATIKVGLVVSHRQELQSTFTRGTQ